MVRKPGLFNEAMAGFYRATEAVARRRADEAEDAVAMGEPASRQDAAPPAPATADDPASLSHPDAAAIPAIDETDTRWLDAHRPEGGQP